MKNWITIIQVFDALLYIKNKLINFSLISTPINLKIIASHECVVEKLSFNLNLRFPSTETKFETRLYGVLNTCTRHNLRFHP